MREKRKESGGNLKLDLRFIGVANSLPTTSYVKMIDIWLLFNLVVPFVEVFSLHFIELPDAIFLGVFPDLHRVSQS